MKYSYVEVCVYKFALDYGQTFSFESHIKFQNLYKRQNHDTIGTGNNGHVCVMTTLDITHIFGLLSKYYLPFFKGPVKLDFAETVIFPFQL
jgi:hypothetical protein